MRMLFSLGFVREEGWTFDKYTLLNVEDRERTFLERRVSAEASSQFVIADA
jgi:hypothetical protein